MRGSRAWIPKIDETRTFLFGRKTLGRKKITRAHSKPKHTNECDISPEEIEARYQRRLAELKWERNNPQ